MGRQLVAASPPALDSPAAAAEPAGRPASHLEVLAVPAPTLEWSAVVHNFIHRFIPAVTRLECRPGIKHWTAVQQTGALIIEPRPKVLDHYTLTQCVQ
jgi:hypothetical protein